MDDTLGLSERLRIVAEVTLNHDSQWAAINAVVGKLGMGAAETVRKMGARGRGFELQLAAVRIDSSARLAADTCLRAAARLDSTSR